MVIVVLLKPVKSIIRNLIAEMYSKVERKIFNRKQANMIVERIVYKIDANNLPDILHLRQLIQKEASKKTHLFF